MQSAIPACAPVRLSSVLAAAVALAIAAASYAAAPPSSHEAHHPDGAPQTATPCEQGCPRPA